MKLLILSEQDYEILTKGIAVGVLVGIIIGAIVSNITLFFSLGGVVGILVSGIRILVKKLSI